MKTQWHKLLTHITQTVTLTAALTFGSMVLAQGASASAELQVKADEMGQETFKRKNGQVLRFKEISVLNAKEKEVIFDDEMTESEFNAYSKWQKQRLDAAKAREDAADKRLAAEKAKLEAVLRRITTDLNRLVPLFEQKTLSGRKLKQDEKNTLMDAVKDQNTFIPMGLNPSVIEIAKNLLARPELFEK
jgi:ABC-type phosphate transport system auxiliary subunit